MKDESLVCWNCGGKIQEGTDIEMLAAFKNAINQEILESLVEDLQANDMQSLEATLTHWASINLPKG